MSIHNLSKYALPLAVTLLLGMTGCSSDSDSSGGTVTPTATEETYTGDKSLSGSFETFSSTSSAPARRAAARRLAAGDTNATEVVKLYVLDENGDMKDTNITCDITGTSTYECNDIAGDKEYIVRYVKNLGDGRVLELKSNVAVGDSDVSGAEVSRVTSLIVEAIAKAVEEAVVGVDIDESKVSELIASVKTAIRTSISNLVQEGLISIPSEDDMTVEADFTEFVGTAQENEKLQDSSGVIVSDETVSNTLDSGKNEAKLSVYASMTTKELVTEIFTQAFGEDDGVPDWVVDFLADKYTSGDFTVGSFLAKLEFESEGFRDDDDNEQTPDVWSPNDWYVQELEKAGVPAGSQENLVSGIISTLDAKMTNGEAFTALKAEILAHYALKEKTDKTDADYKELAEFPPVIEFLFPKAFAETMTSETPLQNMGQGIVLIAFVEGVLAEGEILTAVENVATGDVFEDQIRNMYIVEIDPEFLFEDLGFVNELASYDTLGINYFEARTDKSWIDINGTGTEVEFLSVYSDVEKPSWMFGGAEANASKFGAVTLTYPTATGTGVVDLDVRVEGDWVQLSYSPWGQCDETGCTQDESKMDITDHVSGDYVVSVTYDGETVTKTFNTFVLKGAFDIRAKLISPTEMPQWPEELNGENVDWANLTTQQQALMDEFNTAQQAYEPTRFAVNMDTDNDDVNDSVSGVVFKWDDTALKTQLAALDLPENIIPAYQVGINLYNPNCTSTNYEECNTEIYNTWWNNKAIKATSFKLPIPLKDSGLDGRYNIGVNVVFLDKNTGREVGQGGHTWAEFKVGSADVLVGDEQIVMNGSVSSENVDANLSALNLKVALMSEECTFNETTFVHTCTRAKIGSEVAVVDGNFSLSIAAKTIKDSMDSKGYINLIAFDDRNSDGEFTDWNSTVGANNDDAEMAFWPHNTNVNFENWGEFRVGVSVCPEMTADSTTDMSYECTYNSKRIIPSTDVSYVGDIVIDGIDFKIWGYFSDEDLAGTVPSTEPTQEN